MSEFGISWAGPQLSTTGYQHENAADKVGKAADGVNKITEGFGKISNAYYVSIKAGKGPLNKKSALNKILYTFSRIMSSDWSIFLDLFGKKKNSSDFTIATKKDENQTEQQVKGAVPKDPIKSGSTVNQEK